MWLVAGLGNPGREYAGTRHNLGYAVVETLAGRWAVELDREGFDGRYGKGRLPEADLEVLLLKPATFMNRSGESVVGAMQFFKVSPDRLIVAVDDLALPVGRIRLRPGGSAGGHKGLADIIGRLGRDDFGRVRLGIGAPPPRVSGRDYVLSRPGDEERAALAEAVRQAADAIETWIRRGVELAMNQFNRPVEEGSSGRATPVDPEQSGSGG